MKNWNVCHRFIIDRLQISRLTYGILLASMLIIPQALLGQNVFIRHYETYTPTGFSNILSDYEQEAMFTYWKVILSRNLTSLKGEYYVDDVLSEVWDFKGDKVFRREFYSESELDAIVWYDSTGKPTHTYRYLDYWQSEIFERDAYSAFWRVYFDKETKDRLMAVLYRFHELNDSASPFYRSQGAAMVKLYWNPQNYIFRQESYDLDGNLEWLILFNAAQEADTPEIRGFFIDEDRFRSEYWAPKKIRFYNYFDENTLVFKEEIPRGIALQQDSYKVVLDKRDFPIQVEQYRFISHRRYLLEKTITISYFHSDLLKQVDVFKPNANYPLYSWQYTYNPTNQLVRKAKLIYDSSGGAKEEIAFIYIYDSHGRLGSALAKQGELVIGNEAYTYDGNNNLTQKIQRMTNGTWGFDAHYSYDKLNRLLHQTVYKQGYLHIEYSYSYDAAGNMAQQTEDRIGDRIQTHGFKRMAAVGILPDALEGDKAYQNALQSVLRYAEPIGLDTHSGHVAIETFYSPNHHLDRRTFTYPDPSVTFNDYFNSYDRMNKREVYVKGVLDHVLFFNEKGDCIREVLYDANQITGIHSFVHTATGNILRVDTYQNDRIIQSAHFSQRAIGLYGSLKQIEYFDASGKVMKTISNVANTQ